MRPDIFEELAPVCPRCLHGSQIEAPLIVAARYEERAGHLWHGMLHCSNQACWMEFPVIDGVPVIVPDPPTYVANSRAHILHRTDLPEDLESCIGDACGPGSELDQMRQHLSLYASDHFSDWTGGGETPCIVETLETGLSALGAVEGPAIDLGGSVGRGGWTLAGRVGLGLVGDLNFSMLSLGQRLAVEGCTTFPKRRVGIVYDRVTVERPADAPEVIDFWAMDAMALPFRAGQFGLVSAINLVDCIPGPTELLMELARIAAPGAGVIVATPHDWSANATELGRWMGGHSQRAAGGGATEPVLRATLEQAGFDVVDERFDLPWRLTLHARSVMHYQLHLLAARRGQLS